MKREEKEYKERTQPWQDEALQLSQIVDENLQELQQKEATLLQKVAEHVTEALLEETCHKDKQMTKVLQQFKQAYNIISGNIKCTKTKRLAMSHM